MSKLNNSSRRTITAKLKWYNIPELVDKTTDKVLVKASKYFTDRIGGTIANHLDVIATRAGDTDLDKDIQSIRENIPNELLVDAAKRGHAGKIKSLLAQGADINYRDGEPLRTAASNNRPSIINLLLQHGAKVTSSEIDLVVYAWKDGYDKVFNILLPFITNDHLEYVINDEEIRGLAREALQNRDPQKYGFLATISYNEDITLPKAA